MDNFFAELKRRHIYRVAVAYALVAWVLLQLVNNVAPVLDLPPWIARAILLVLVIGFPVALVFAWIHQLAPVDAALARGTAGKLDWFLAGALVLVIGLVSYQQLAPAVGSRTVELQQAGVAAARRAALSPAGAISIAVLPFANLSSDKEQEFFSDGMTEELTSVLAKIPDLRVVGRTSAFQFKGQNQDLRAIGRALSATHLLEGSVRKEGNRLRITAQLIQAENGVHVWTESYDRELTGVFAIQEDIATAIAGALRMPLGLKPGERLVSDRPADQETYDLYLRGRAALRSRTRQELELLGQVVARDPNFAPGWAMLAEARREMALYFERYGEVSKRGPLVEGSETAARKAIALAPNYAGGYAALAAVTSWRGKWMEAIDLFKQGLARDPEAPELLTSYGSTLSALGYLKEALSVRERLSLVEPLIPLYNRQRASLLLANGMADAGLSELLRLNGGGGVILVLPAAYAHVGRFAEAAGQFDMVLSSAPPAAFAGFYARPLVEAAAQVLHAVANKSDPPAQLPDFADGLNFVYAYTSAPERMLDWPEKTLKEGDYRNLGNLWWPTPSSVRKTERFKALVRNAGLVAYWRAKGWPDLCRPVGADDFVCD